MVSEIETSNSYIDEIELLLKKSKEFNFKKKQDGLFPAEEALEIAVKHNDVKYRVICLTWLATVYCESFSDYNTALELCEQAKDIALHSVDESEDLLVRIHITTGLCYHYLGDLESSYQNYIEAVKISENQVHETDRSKEALGNLYYNIAVLFKGADYAEQRKSYLDKALEIYHATGFKVGIARCYNAYSSYYASLENPEDALDYQKKALKISEEIDDKYGTSIYYNNIGSMYVEKRDFEKGLYYINKGLELKILVGNKHSIAVSYLHLGIACCEMQEFEKAIANLLKAEEIMIEIDSKVFLHDTYKHLSEAYAGIGDFENAYKIQGQYLALRDELFNFDKSTAINTVRTKYEIEKREKETQWLRQKNDEIEDHVRKLEISNNELRQFAHVASHDLKEPLRMIGSYIGLLEKKAIEKLNDEEKQFIGFAVEGAKRMDELINGLLLLTKVNSNPINDVVDLNNTLKDVKLNLRGLIQSSGANIILEELPRIKADRIQMIQLFQNLISNSIKYNKSEVPQISITYSFENAEHFISVADNGIGIPEQYRDKVFNLFQRLHARTEYSGTGIGLAICKKIVAQQKGRIWIESNLPNGTVFKIALPA
jgi:signal transduction histidine kinase